MELSWFNLLLQFTIVYERNSLIWVNVKVDPQWRDMWRQVYPSAVPAYHQNKEHWNSIILNGSIPDDEIKRMIAESYALIKDLQMNFIRLRRSRKRLEEMRSQCRKALLAESIANL